jgi:poly-beta-1,6-N-acetyl-D-glucosamine synthase
MKFITYIIAILCVLNLVRMLAYLVGSDISSTMENLRQFKNKKAAKRTKYRYTPSITVLVPAHNEEASILNTLNSLQASKYPPSKLKIVVINDGSTDQTGAIVKDYIKVNKLRFATKLVNQVNKGKATALNNGLKKHVTTTLVMCLDADSSVTPTTVRNITSYFRDRAVKAVSSNVNIIENGTLLGLAQRFEYLMCYRMKRAETLFKVEYIIGGIGSVFRRQDIASVGDYDTNTMTEDIDLSMKLLRVNGNIKGKFLHAPDAITYTQPVANVSSLLRQRYRWKYGRWQTFIKNKSMFYSTEKTYTKQLTWFMLPFALMQELLFLLEPLVVATIFYSSIRFSQAGSLWSAVFVISVYLLLNVWSSDHLSIVQRLRLSFYAPAMYFILYVLTFAEYGALVKGLFTAPKLKASLLQGHTTWVSPKRL